MVACVLALFNGRPIAASAHAQSQQRQAPVEVTIPKPPTPLIAKGQRLLVYELHVTNFGAQSLVLQSVDVFASLDASRPLATLRDSALTASFWKPGAMRMSMSNGSMMSTADTRIGNAERAVIFMWLPIAQNVGTPQLLRHRLTFAIVDSAGNREGSALSTIDSVVTQVNTARVATIRAPLNGGDWLAGEGPSNSSAHRRSLIPFNGKVRISQRFAADWVKIGPNGNTWHDNRSRNENFWGFGEPVIAVGDGEVISTVDTIPDNTPDKLPSTTLATISGNRIILRIGPSEYAMYAHLKRGSVRVRAGQHVKRGDTLALLGNSGQATGPHLHFQMMDAPSDIAAEGIPFYLEKFTFLGTAEEYEPSKHRNIPRQHELPLGDAVVHLPDHSPN